MREVLLNRREGMERLTQSAIGPAGSALLRYGYVPPSLQRLQGERRGQRAGVLMRLVLASSLTITTALGAYHALRGPDIGRVVTVAGIQAPPLAEPDAPAGFAAPVGQRAAESIPMVPPQQPTAAENKPASSLGQLDPQIAAAGTAPLIAFPSDTLLSPRGRAASAAQSRAPAPTVVPVPPLDTNGLRKALQADTAASEGSYGISVIDLSSNQSVNLDATSPMNAASVNKLEILAALYHECAAGRLQMDQTLTTSAANIQDYGTGIIRYQPLGTRYTLAQLAELLIEQSDNTASYMLGQVIGLDTIDALVTSWGLTSTIVGQEVSSPHDAARFLQLLYDGKLANAADTRQMMNYLTHTAFNDRIPAGLPPDVEVAHKIGTQVNVENDVAIVSLAGRPYILSIFARDVTEEHAVPVEQALSRTVYQYELRAKEGP